MQCPVSIGSRAPVWPAVVLLGGSGFAALGVQTVWVRVLAAGVGSEVPALLGVVMAVMIGLGLGAWWLDGPVSRSRHPGRWYAALEGVLGGWVALLAFGLPSVSRWTATAIGIDPSPWAHWGLALGIPTMSLLPATLAMGGTLPAVDRWLEQLGRSNRWVGLAYGANVLGAAVGVLGSVVWLMPQLGFRRTALAFAVVHGLVALVAVVWPRFFAGGIPPDQVSSQPGPEGCVRLGGSAAARPEDPRGWLLAAAVAGFLGVGYELLGIRLLGQLLENTVYTYAVVLAVYLAGTSAGALLYQRWGGRLGPQGGCAALAAGTALGTLVGIVMIELSPALFRALDSWAGPSLWGAAIRDGVLAALIFIPPTAGMGALLCHLAQSNRSAQGGVGRVLAWNCLGSALAPAAMGGLLLPGLGSRFTADLLALGYLGLASVWVWFPRASSGGRFPRSRLLPGTALAWLAVVLSCDLQLHEPPSGTVILSRRESVYGVVSVLQEPDGNRVLRVDHRFQMGGTAAADSLRLQAHIPLLLHPDPRRCLFLGTGTGITLGAATLYPGLTTDGVELLPDVVRAMPAFEPANRLMEVARRGRMHIADARRFVLATPERYDVVVADLFQPARDGAGLLYTREHFAAGRDRLVPGGLFCQWLPLHQLDAQSLSSIARTFLEVFPTCELWLLRPSAEAPVAGLVGYADESTLRSPRPKEWPLPASEDSGLHEELVRLGLKDPVRLLGLRLGGAALVRALGDAAPVSTDDWPVVVFAAPRRAVDRLARPQDRLRELLALSRRLPPEQAEVAGPPGDPLGDRVGRYRAARDLYLEGLMADAEGEPGEALRFWIESARGTADFTSGYAQVLGRATLLADSDPEEARRLLKALAEAQPAIPVATQMLQRLPPHK